jgi:hypothetical protein
MDQLSTADLGDSGPAVSVSAAFFAGRRCLHRRSCRKDRQPDPDSTTADNDID